MQACTYASEECLCGFFLHACVQWLKLQGLALHFSCTVKLQTFINIEKLLIPALFKSQEFIGGTTQCHYGIRPCRGVVGGAYKLFLNQARAGRRPARAWFLRIAFVREVSMRVCVCVCVCPPPRLWITSGVFCGVMWSLNNQWNKSYYFKWHLLSI